jgi:carbamoyltransferase
VIILGLNSFHGDAAACLVRDGVLIAAAEEERFRRVKHWAGFPTEAIKYCLAEASITINDVDRIALNQDNRANLAAKLKYLFRSRPKLSTVLERARHRIARETTTSLLRKCFPDAIRLPKIDRVEHHLAHLSSAFHVSPFDEAVVVSIDGFGDFASAAWGVGRGASIEREGQVLFPHSLGIFYQAITQYLGFPHYGDEYKVMGLAPYGQLGFVEEMRRIVRVGSDGAYELDLKFFRHHEERIAFEWSGGSPEFGDLFTPALEDLLGPRRAPSDPLENRHRDIARSAQATYEETFFNLLNLLYQRHPIPTIALAGGCAMNSVANGKVRRMTPFKKVYVQSAAGDAGGAIGSAFVVWHREGGRRSFVMDHAYWGPHFDDHRLKASWMRTGDGSKPRVVRSSGSTTRRSFANGRRQRSPMVRSSAGFRGAWSGAQGPSAIAPSSAIRAAPT